MTEVNGIVLEQLNGTIEAVKQNPSLGQATFQSRVTWEKGFQSTAEIGDYVQAGSKVSRGKQFHVKGDHPEGLLGHNSAPAAVETLIASVGSCVSGGWATFGAAMGIPVEKLEIQLQGDIDLQGFMGLGNGVDPVWSAYEGPFTLRARLLTSSSSSLRRQPRNSRRLSILCVYP